jgi:WXG100 family type VII secretion target
MSDGLNLTYEDIQNMATRLESEAERFTTEIGDVKGEVDELVESGFQAASSRAFQEQFEDFTTGLKQMIEGMNGLAAFLTTAAEQFAEVDSQLEGMARGE